MEDLLKIEDLSVSFTTDAGTVEVLDKVSIHIGRGETLSLVGESIMRLLPYPSGKVTSGKITFDDKDMMSLPIGEMYRMRGSSIAMIFQEPMTALNPVHLIKNQIAEVLRLHRKDIPEAKLNEHVLKYLRDVEMPSPEMRLNNYPFQLSGGMRQRVMIAMALAGHPKLLIADEPTTALDVTVQAQIIALIKDLQKKNNMSVMYITHDMGVVAEVSDRVAVMYAGQVVESADVVTIFKNPRHPYTRGLIASMPKLDSKPKTRLPYIKGSVPTPRAYPATCRFAERCSYANDHCRNNTPTLEYIEDNHRIRCFRAKELEDI